MAAVPQSPLIFFVSGMWCSSCARNVVGAVERIPGVKAADVNFSTKLLLVELRDASTIEDIQGEIMKRVEGVGFSIRRQSNDWILNFKNTLNRELENRLSWTRVAAVWFLSTWSTMLGFTHYLGGDITANQQYWLAVASALLGIPAILLGIDLYGKSGLRALLRNRQLTLDLIISLGAASAVLVTVISILQGRALSYADSGSMIMGVLLLTKKIESEFQKKVTFAILYDIDPLQSAVKVFRKEEWQSAEPSQIKVGSLVRFEPGETILYDGKLVSSTALVNLHLLNGESAEQTLHEGAQLHAGSIACSVLEMKAEKVLGQRLVDEWAASAIVGGVRSSSFSKMMRRFETGLTFLAIGGASALAIHSWITNGTLAAAAESFFIGILVFCPCVFASILPLATEFAYLALARIGIRMRRSEALIDLLDLDQIAFDKTGTLQSVESHFVDSVGGGFNELFLEELALKSQHPIMKGISTGKDYGIFERVEEVPGAGIRAMTYYGERLVIGSSKFLKENGIRLERSFNDSYPGVAFKGALKGQLILKRAYDQDALDVLNRLPKLAPKAKISVLSGDPSQSAGTFVTTIFPHIEYFGSLSPEDKKLQLSARSLFVGDGLNDTLALAKAKVSIRVGSRASGLAPVDFEVAPIGFRNLIRLFLYAKKYRSVVIQTVALAFTYNVVALYLAARGLFIPLTAVLAMFLSFSILMISISRLMKVPGN